MKKIIVSLFVLLSVAVLTGCFADINTLEWETLPKSVYAEDEITESAFMESVSIKIDGTKVTLQQAVNSHGAIVSGFDVTSSGDRVITVKYKSLTIYWAYKVGGVTPTTVTPAYGWYADETATSFTINNIEDLYGFANIVNGKGGKTAFSFAGKTVKLGADIDLTGKVWEPIGAAPRKRNVPLDVLSSENLFIDVSKIVFPAPATINRTEATEENKLYFDIYTSGANVVVSICSSYIQDGILKVNKRDFLSLTKTVYNTLNLTELKNQVINALNSKINAGSIEDKYFIAPEIYSEETNSETNYITIAGKKYNFTYSGEIQTGNFFSGLFDGQGYRIIGLSDVGYTPTVVLTYANSSTIVTGYTFGLFGVAKGNVSIKNITFENLSIIGSYYHVGSGLKVAEIDSVGSAVGFSFGVGDLFIDNITVSSGSINAFSAAGGVVGRIYNYGKVTVQNCINRANITSLEKHTGGIVAFIAETGGPTGGTTNVYDKEIKNCTNYGNISAIPTHAGAIVRFIQNGKTTLIENCRNFGNITGTAASHGMTGNSMVVKDCTNYGALN